MGPLATIYPYLRTMPLRSVATDIPVNMQEGSQIGHTEAQPPKWAKARIRKGGCSHLLLALVV